MQPRRASSSLVRIRVRVRVRVKGNPNHDLDQVSSVVNLDFVTEHGDATCTLGNNYCYRVMMMMLGIPRLRART